MDLDKRAHSTQLSHPKTTPGRPAEACAREKQNHYIETINYKRSILLFTNFLAIAFTRKRLFHAFLLTRFQIKRVTLYFLDNVLGLHLAFETAQSIFEGFSFLNTNLCQEKYTSQSGLTGLI